MKLYFEQLKRERKDTVKDFLYKVINHAYGVPKTYTKKTCTEASAQCRANKARSFSDLYNIVKTYYPNVTVKKFSLELYKVLKDHKKGKRNVLLYCPNVNKWTVHTNWQVKRTNKNLFFDGIVYNYNEALPHKYDKPGVGKYTLLNILTFMEIPKKQIIKELGNLILSNKLENTNSRLAISV